MIISLILVGGSFIFLKKVEDRTKLIFMKPHYRLWSTPVGFVVEQCVYNKCQTIDQVSINQRTDVELDADRHLLYFIKNGSLLARNLLNRSENEIYKLSPEDGDPVFSISNNGRFTVLFTGKEEGRYYWVFDLTNNTSEKKQITFAKKDDQIVGSIDDFGKVDFHIMGLVRGGMEGQQDFIYVTNDGNTQYKLVDNLWPYFTVAKQGNKILYEVDTFLRKLDLASGAIEDKKTEDNLGFHLSSNGHFAIKQKCDNTDFCRFILWDIDSDKDYLLFTNNEGMFIDGFWSNNDKYYIFSGAGGLHLVDISTKRVYWPWTREDKYANWSLIDMW